MQARFRWLLGLLLVLSWGAWHPADSQASCEVHTTTPTYTDLTFLGVDLCDANGNKLTSIGGSTGGTNTAAAPTRVEGSAGAPSYDLSGNQRVTLGTLLSGEDQANNLLMTSGGAVRITTLGSVTSATTSTPQIVPTGFKTFMGQITNATSETKAITATIYGNWTSSTTGGKALCTITLPSTATVTHLEDSCDWWAFNAPYSFYYFTTSVYTSASAAPFTIWPMY